jgi:hypothetical protein
LLVHRRTARAAFVISDRVKVIQEFILEATLRRNSQHASGRIEKLHISEVRPSRGNGGLQQISEPLGAGKLT